MVTGSGMEKLVAAGASGDGMNSRCMPSAASALWYAEAGKAELRTEPLSSPAEGEALVRTHFSLVSRGTERLVFSGQVPASEWQRMRAPLQTGEFPFPVKYGYAAIGEVIEGPKPLKGRLVFALHPHQDWFNAPVQWLTPVPDGVPARRAVLAANMETALNALWDGGALAGQKIAVVGAGIVGLLVAYLCARLPGAEVLVADVLAERRALVTAFGAEFCQPGQLPDDCDLVFHTSAHPEGLAAALAACGNEATLVELSWYGDKAVGAALGGAFHVRRLRLISSQVGQVSPAQRARWSHQRRLGKALELLADPILDQLLGEEIAFNDLPATCPRLFAKDASGLTAVIRYSDDRQSR